MYCFLGYADMRLILGYESGGKGCAWISFYIKGAPPPISFHAPRPLHLQSLKLQLHVLQCTITPLPLTLPAFQASRPWPTIITMEDLPPLPSSRNSPRAPSERSSSPELSETHLYIRDFVRETRQRLNFTSTQLPILDDHQLSGLSDGETILVPLSCSSLNALASMTRQLDTIKTQLGNIQTALHTMPTWTALQGTLEPINAAIRDLSHRVAAPPPQAPAPTRPPVPPTGATTRQQSAPTRPSAPPPAAPAFPLPRPKTRAPPPNKTPTPSFDPDIPRYDVGTRSFYGDPRAYADKFPDSWEANAFREGKYPDPTTFIAGHLAPDYVKPHHSYAKAASAGAPKGKKNKSSLTAAQVASASNSVPVTQPPKSLPTAERRFFAPRSSPSEH